MIKTVSFLLLISISFAVLSQDEEINLNNFQIHKTYKKSRGELLINFTEVNNHVFVWTYIGEDRKNRIFYVYKYDKDLYLLGEKSFNLDQFYSKYAKKEILHLININNKIYHLDEYKTSKKISYYITEFDTENLSFKESKKILDVDFRKEEIIDDFQYTISENENNILFYYSCKERKYNAPLKVKTYLYNHNIEFIDTNEVIIENFVTYSKKEKYLSRLSKPRIDQFGNIYMFVKSYTKDRTRKLEYYSIELFEIGENNVTANYKMDMGNNQIVADVKLLFENDKTLLIGYSHSDNKKKSKRYIFTAELDNAKQELKLVDNKEIDDAKPPENPNTLENWYFKPKADYYFTTYYNIKVSKIENGNSVATFENFRSFFSARTSSEIGIKQEFGQLISVLVSAEGKIITEKVLNKNRLRSSKHASYSFALNNNNFYYVYNEYNSNFKSNSLTEVVHKGRIENMSLVLNLVNKKGTNAKKVLNNYKGSHFIFYPIYSGSNQKKYFVVGEDRDLIKILTFDL